MDALDILRDLVSRPRDAAERLRRRLNPVSLNARPGGHDNSVAWLLWHSGREIDVQLAALTGQEQLWTAQGYAARFDLGPEGDSVGYGHTPEQARRILVEDADLLLGYLDAAFGAVDDYLSRLTADELDDVVDEQWDPPVTRGARLVSLVDDAVQHVAQAAFSLGMPERD
ncbi:DinB family protein [Brachybacterium sp. FME24]|uniref:mycothiol transferase n=1 Tax=Brachybacterium sp. FME24 TaxID=2742605 RepID=UPI001865D17F|nr:DinB family protein [Brachybacterium sp. FME24]